MTVDDLQVDARAGGLRVLMVHGRYRIRGGEEEVFEAERRLLERAGIAVDIYEEDNNLVERQGLVQTALDTVWSRRCYEGVRAQLRRKPCHVMHVHNFFPLLSPSIYYAAKAEGVAVVQTLHNYRLMCAAGIFQRDGNVCEDCLGKPVAWPAVLHGCYRGSRAGSAAIGAMQASHWLLGSWRQKVDRYIALTEFGRQKFIEGGLPADRIAVKPNFVAPDPGAGPGDGGFAIYAGRLSVEKGLRQILQAWKLIGDRLPLRIMGDGPLAAEVADAADQTPGVTYLGRQPNQRVIEAMGAAQCFIFGSTWYEGLPRVICEAYARGLPLIASDIGPIASIVEHGRSGLLFEPGNVADMVAKVEAFIADPQGHGAMRWAARASFERHYTADDNLGQLLSIYRAALADYKAHSHEPATV